jgi:glyceraldehyde-3-phosphate dehydrogenase type I
MVLRVAINGFGRIGRMLFRLWLRQCIDSQDAGTIQDANAVKVEIVAINDVADWHTLAYLLEFDSTHGRFPQAVFFDEEKKILSVAGRAVPVFQESDPADLPWVELNVDVVVESSRKYRTKQALSVHLKQGAKRVLLACPGDASLDCLSVYGINHLLIAQHQYISAASCTVNALAVALKPLQSFSVQSLSFTEIHAVTADQKTVDCAHSDIRRSRASGVNMIPTPTRATTLIAEVLPEYHGVVQGYSLRVPVLNVACLDMTVVCQQPVSVDEVHQAYRQFADTSLKEVLFYNEQPLVSTDFIGHYASAVYDATQTSVVANVLKIVVWYDNEWGYASRLWDLLQYLQSIDHS